MKRIRLVLVGLVCFLVLLGLALIGAQSDWYRQPDTRSATRTAAPETAALSSDPGENTGRERTEFAEEGVKPTDTSSEPGAGAMEVPGDLVLIAEGWRAIQAGDEAAYEAALIKVPSDARQAARRAFLRGAWAVQQRQLETALTELRAAAALPELRVRAMVLAGQAFYQAGLATNAQQMWMTVLHEYPDAVDAHRWIAIFYYDLGAMADALQHLERVSKLAPTDPRADRLMGLINKDFERFDRAINHYRETLRRDPKQPAVAEIRYELAECQLKLRDYAAALETLAEAPDQARRFALEADAQYSLGKTDLAEQALKKSLSLQPDLLAALLLQATWQLEAGETEQAAETLSLAVKKHPFDYQARFQFAQTLRRVGRTTEAEQVSAAAADLRQKWERFSQWNEQAIREPTNAELRVQLGDLARQIGKPELAIGWYQAALAIDPTLKLARERLQQPTTP